MKTYLRAYCDRAVGPGEPGDTLNFVASTEGVKRDNEELEVSRWRLTNYLANPVFLWAHDYMGRTLPIGRTQSVEVSDKKLLAKVVFDQADEFARQVEDKYRRGFLNAVSVGWMTLKEGKETVYDLMDISAVPVPGDPDALIEREYIALRGIITGSDNADDGEGSWEELATKMARLFFPDPDDTDVSRIRTYRSLLPAYRRLHRVPPEFRTAEELSALDADDILGLFLEGEDKFIRAGAVLSTRNREKLEQARILIQDVLNSAQKEETDDETDETDETDEGRTAEFLRTVSNKLQL